MTRPIAVVVVSLSLLIAGCGSGSREDSAPKGKSAMTLGGNPMAPAARTSKKNANPAVAALPSTQPARPLPDDIDLNTSDVELAAHALIAAREDVSIDSAGGATVEQRQQFLYQSWYPLMLARQAELQAIVDARGRMSALQVAEARRQHGHDVKLADTEAEYARKIEAEKRKTVPILDK
jgi:hypothetical protein